jgi:ATP-dependent RNA helicase DHX37/DHR1
LKLVIMSATLSVRDFSGSAALFPSPLWPRPPPVVSVAARQHPVSLHFARRTSDAVGYASDALAKACKVHTRLPPGGLLIFLTGQDEVEFVCAELRKRFCGGRRAAAAAAAEAASAATKAALAAAAQAAKAAAAPAAGADADADADADAAPAAAAATGSAPPAPAPAPALAPAPPSPCVVLPLYSMLSPAAQARVFAPVPEGHRLIVVATNVAETSITIPGIR